MIAAGSFIWHPYYIRDKKTGEITGVLHDILAETCRRAEVDFTFQNSPWKRVMDYARYGDIDIVCGLYWTKERAEYLDFSAPLFRDEVRIFTNKPLHINSLNDLIGLRGTAILGSSYGKDFDEFSEKYLNLMRAPDKSQFVERLLSDETDYVVCGHLDCSLYFAADSQASQIRPLPYSVSSNNVYLGFSKNSKRREILTKLNKTIDEMVQDGTVNVIYRRYMR